MLIDDNLDTTGTIGAGGLDVHGALAVRAEANGFDGAWAPETSHDVFVSLALMARATERITLGSNIAVAFARTPMTLAYAANDLQLASDGRFVLGLGSQVKAHITRRFGMEWSAPADRMRDFVRAVKAIWTSWNDGSPLDFRGDFYRHSLMSPVFDPGPNPHGAPPVYLAAVNERMTAVAGEVADGLLGHPFTTERYLREVTLPALARGAARSGRAAEAVTVVGNPLVAVGRTDAELQVAIDATRSRIAFYASTPSYRSVLELHGWTELGDRLTQLSKDARWSEMGSAVSDEVLEQVTVVGAPDAVARSLHERYGGLYDRAIINRPYESEPALLDPIRAGGNRQ